MSIVTSALGQLWKYFDKGGLLLVLQSISYHVFNRDLVTPLLVPFYRVYHTIHDKTVSYRGIKMDSSHTVIDQLLPEFLTSYEFSESVLLDRHFPGDCDVIELGAGIGFISCYTNLKTESERTHVVVEANPLLIDIIKDTRQLNGCNFDTLHAAYAPSSKYVTFTQREKFLSSSISTGKTESSSDQLTVSGTSLESISSRYDIDQFILVADIEGAEHEMIRAESEILAERCPLVFVEIHETNEKKITECVDLFRDAGFIEREREGDVWVFENTKHI